MQILGTTNLQHEDVLYLAEARSCVNKLLLFWISTDYQILPPAIILTDVNKTYLLSFILFGRHPRISNVCEVPY